MTTRTIVLTSELKLLDCTIWEVYRNVGTYWVAKLCYFHHCFVSSCISLLLQTEENKGSKYIDTSLEKYTTTQPTPYAQPIFVVRRACIPKTVISLHVFNKRLFPLPGARTPRLVTGNRGCMGGALGSRFQSQLTIVTLKRGEREGGHCAQTGLAKPRSK